MNEEEMTRLSLELNEKIVEVAKGYPADCMLDTAVGFLSAYAAFDEDAYSYVLSRIHACVSKLQRNKKKALSQLDSEDVLEVILETYGK